MLHRDCNLQTLGRSRLSEKDLSFHTKLENLMTKFVVKLDKPNVEPF